MQNRKKKKYKNKKKYTKKEICVIICAVLLLVALGCLLYIVVKPFYKVEPRAKEIKEAEKNYDKKVVGWIRVQGTDIDYPIIRSRDDVAMQNYSYAWTEFSSYNVNNRKVLFGHNILNLSSNPRINDDKFSGFEDILSFLYPNFLKDNKYIQYTAGGKDYLYKIFSVSFVETSEGKFYTGSMNKGELTEYIKKAKKDSYFDFDVDVNSNDGIITLVTCTRFFGTLSGYSFRIDARRIRNGETISNYDFKEKKNYNKIKEKLKGDEVSEKA